MSAGPFRVSISDSKGWETVRTDADGMRAVALAVQAHHGLAHDADWREIAALVFEIVNGRSIMNPIGDKRLDEYRMNFLRGLAGLTEEYRRD